ncbi:MAG: DUF1178 family protein [Proteobacteria bacterium]|nr:DUF1178 family protein [Pseudomonadota bacterium]MBU4298247.1 DUF1178 family protein [Pseudomonadota bacterium]MCG2747515.1 DUF1178 family protein [Desulfobulbaceae bacterium]
MIVFDLACECGFFFEGWFKDHEEFAKQEREGLLICPQCQGRQCLRKVLSPVAYQKKSCGTLADGKPPAEMDPARLAESVEQTIRIIQEFVEKNFEDVGSDFTRKTLKIHYGVEEPKNIRGVVTQAEEKMLDKEGIPYLKIPRLNKKEGH